MTEKKQDIFSSNCINMVNDIFNILEVSLEETNEQERQIIAAFSFGMVNAYGIEEKVEPVKIHGLIVGILIKIFKYSEKESVDFAQILINSTNSKHNQNMYTIIYRGMQAYYDYKEDKSNDVYDNLTYIIDMIVNKE